MSEKLFLLGVGCQKGGTTWLHQYLDSHPQCNLGFQKEYHVFDAKYLEACRGIYRNRQASLESLMQARQQDAGKANSKLDEKILRKSQLVSFYEEPASYADYFARLYDEDSNTKLVGDITPAYSALAAEHYSGIRALLEAHGFTVKVVFLMRDPIERIYSAIYMEIARKKRRRKSIDKGPEKLFLSKYDDAKTEMKTRYENTIINLDKSFETENTYLGFYETLFNDEGVRGVTDFLEIDFVKPDTGKKVHAASQKKPLSGASIKRVREYYDHTYRFCYDRFGQEFISTIWKNAELRADDDGFLGKIRRLTGI